MELFNRKDEGSDGNACHVLWAHLHLRQKAIDKVYSGEEDVVR